jgi:HEPN domain-containing protein
MDYYKLSEEPMASAKLNFDNGLYRMSVNMSTLAIDLLLKSVVKGIDRASDYLMGHDHIGMLRLIETRYPKPELRMIVKLSRKYFNESRYSNSENFPTFTEDLAAEFIAFTERIKDFVDTECLATTEDLLKRFQKP